MRRGIKLVFLAGSSGIVGQSQNAHRSRVQKCVVKEMLGQAQGGGVHRQQAQAERFHGVKILDQGVPKAGQIRRPLIAALIERVGRAAVPAPGLTSDEKRLANIRLTGWFVLIVLGLLKPLRHIADAFAIDLDGKFPLKR